MKPSSYLIIGSGVAGLTFAIKIATHFPEKNVVIITKSNEDESNTKYAQGGIAIVVDDTEDSYQKHIEDTLICGAGLCNPEVVKMVVTEGPKRFKELLAWGTQFDKNAEGKFDLGKEGGHSENRVVHHKDQTGFEIERAILEKVHQLKNIIVLDHHFALYLLMKDNCCFGATVLNQKTNSIITLPSEYTLLATGGIGHLYGHTTNPVIATGDGIAMAFRANATIKDMEFIQFHPTALYASTTRTAFLISEAVRGFGAYLRTKDGKRFMKEYDPRMELASRDIVSQSIDLELQKTGDDCVYLDCTHLDLKGFIKHFPMIYEHCKSLGIDIAKDWIPVLPAQHYLCGGIAVDQNGKTSITNLFACGECSYTGLHGANRLASNSLLEALVYSDKIYTYLANAISENKKLEHHFSELHPVNQPKISLDYCVKMKTQLQLLMRKNAGIVRNDTDLRKARKLLSDWQTDLKEKIKTHEISSELYELYNMITVGYLIIEHSINRTENCGSYHKK
jgi:L-aspartate oxidase